MSFERTMLIYKRGHSPEAARNTNLVHTSLKGGIMVFGKQYKSKLTDSPTAGRQTDSARQQPSSPSGQAVASAA